MIQVETIGDKKIAIKGIGKLFYQEGFPIPMSILELSKKGIEVSIFHVADECLKHGWSPKTTYNKLIADFQDDITGHVYDTQRLHDFCFASYEDQREMIFNHLFGNVEQAKNWLRCAL